MKKLLIIALVLVFLVGCVSQKALQTQKWHIEYLQVDLQNYKKLSAAYADSLKSTRTLAISTINQQNAKIKLYEPLIREFIVLSNSTIVDSLLKKYGLKLGK